MFTYDYWCSEIKVFQDIFSQPDRQEAVYVLALNGITLMAAHLVVEDQEHKTEVLAQYKKCLDQALALKGRDWLARHGTIISTHGKIPPT